MRILLPSNLKQFGKKTIWIWTLVLTGVVIALFASTTDLASIREALGRVGYTTLAIVFTCFFVNSTLAVVWLSLITKSERGARGSVLRVMGWYMLATILLPVRLGDVAWMYLIHKWLALPPGRSIFIALYHRLLDFIVTSLFFLLSGLLVGTKAFGDNYWFAAAGLFLSLFLIVLCLEFFLTLGARIFIQLKDSSSIGVVEMLLRQILQIRLWYRHHLTREVLIATFVIIVVRWGLIVVAIGLLISSVASQLGWQDVFLITNVYIYVSIIPLQAFGGFGIGEASLAGMLVVYGVPLGLASAISLLIRLLINLVHFVFWLVIVLYFQISEKAKQAVAHS